jgi:hypothetical protein
MRGYLPDVFAVGVPAYAEMHLNATGPQQPTFILESIRGFYCADFRETQINQKIFILLFSIDLYPTLPQVFYTLGSGVSLTSQ